jgi:hypothetical protein
MQHHKKILTLMSLVFSLGSFADATSITGDAAKTAILKYTNEQLGAAAIKGNTGTSCKGASLTAGSYKYSFTYKDDNNVWKTKKFGFKPYAHTEVQMQQQAAQASVNFMERLKSFIMPNAYAAANSNIASALQAMGAAVAMTPILHTQLERQSALASLGQFARTRLTASKCGALVVRGFRMNVASLKGDNIQVTKSPTGQYKCLAAGFANNIKKPDCSYQQVFSLLPDAACKTLRAIHGKQGTITTINLQPYATLQPHIAIATAVANDIELDLTLSHPQVAPAQDYFPEAVQNYLDANIISKATFDVAPLATQNMIASLVVSHLKYKTDASFVTLPPALVSALTNSALLEAVDAHLAAVKPTLTMYQLPRISAISELVEAQVANIAQFIPARPTFHPVNNCLSQLQSISYSQQQAAY